MSDQRYLVTARKYRPQRFEEIVAQGHVSETLKNAITLDRLAHAYLFSGPRGVGKTTAARILAKAINCTVPLEERDGGEPCRVCDSCRTFEEGRSLNIIEIDAASNNRVEDVRELRDTVLIPPQGSKKKVYIIDEVHMLSNAAFNALLKTLEEPPSYALFIFATTEPNKVLPTILSRCQRFDFRRISIQEIISHLGSICKAENIEADEASLMLIAQKGDGALRDALSAFDQAVSLLGTSLKYTELAEAFGVVDIELFFEVTRLVVAGDSSGLLQVVDKIIRQGYDLQEFLVGLSSHLRNLLVVCSLGDTSLIEAPEPVKQQYAQEVKMHAEADLLRLLMVVADGEEKLKTSAQPRLQLELTLLKMAAMAHAVDLKKALERLDNLESRIVEGNPQPAPAVRHETAQKVVAKVVVSDGATENQASGALPEEWADEPTNEEVKPAKPAGAQSELDPGTGSAQEEAPTRSGYQGLFGTPALRKLQRPGEPSKGETSAFAGGDVMLAEAPAGVELEEILQIWPDFLKHIKMERIHVSALLQHARPTQLQDETLVLSVPDDFHKRMLSNQQEFLLDHLCNFVMAPVERMRFVIDKKDSAALLKQETAPEMDPYEYMQKKRNESPVIRAIFDDFGGEMVW